MSHTSASPPSSLNQPLFRMTDRQAKLQSSGPSHYVVQFDVDHCMCVIPRKLLINPPDPAIGVDCHVLWNGEEYGAKVMAKGTADEAREAESRLLDHLEDKAELPEQPPKKKRRLGILRKGSENPAPKKKTTFGRKRKPFGVIQKVTKKAETTKFDLELGSPAKGLPASPAKASPTPIAPTHSPPAPVSPATVSPPPLPPRLPALPPPPHRPPTHSPPSPSPPYEVNDSILSFSDMSDESMVLNSTEENVITITIDEESPKGKGPQKTYSNTCKCGEVIEALSGIADTVSLLEKRMAVVISHLVEVKEKQEGLEKMLRAKDDPKRLYAISTPSRTESLLLPQRHQPLVPPSTPTQPAISHQPSTLTPKEPQPPKLVQSEPQNPPVTPTTESDTCQEDAKQFELSADKIWQLRYCSSSRKNFSARVVKEIFTEDERAISNVRGVLGKSKLDDERISYVKDVTFKVFPLEGKDKEKTAWSACVQAIDECNRRLNRAKK